MNESKLTAEDKKELDDFAKQADGLQRFVIEVQGFTDKTGPATLNEALSQARAEEVARYLANEHKIPVRSIATLGSGYAAAGRRRQDPRRPQAESPRGSPLVRSRSTASGPVAQAAAVKRPDSAPQAAAKRLRPAAGPSDPAAYQGRRIEKIFREDICMPREADRSHQILSLACFACVWKSRICVTLSRCSAVRFFLATPSNALCTRSSISSRILLFSRSCSAGKICAIRGVAGGSTGAGGVTTGFAGGGRRTVAAGGGGGGNSVIPETITIGSFTGLQPPPPPPPERPELPAASRLSAWHGRGGGGTKTRACGFF